jgi:hypothetical protein
MLLPIILLVALVLLLLLVGKGEVGEGDAALQQGH